MDDITLLEATYKKVIQNPSEFLPDGIVIVDIEILKNLGLLYCNEPPNHTQSRFTPQFHALEATDKITLYNEQFVIWMVPQMINDIPCTLTLIALNDGPDLNLEAGFVTTGVYNTSKHVLRILDRMLEEIRENEEYLSNLS
jgi:hypothetical protein